MLQRHDPALRAWRWRATPTQLELELDVGDATEALRISPPGEGGAWFRSPSFRVGRAPRPGVPPGRTLDQLKTLVQRKDTGTLEWALPDPPAHPPGGAPPVDPERAAALAPLVHWSTFLAWKAVTTEDLYPHITPLGEPIGTPELLDLWRGTLARIRDGRAPQLLGLYVHVPFCTVACSFCYCAKTDGFRRDHVARYVDSLIEEAHLFGPLFEGVPFTSVYFGGGTPSLLTPPQMTRLFEALWRHFDVPPGTQVIYEGNPDSLSARKIEVMGTLGKVTRLTIGVQTLDDEVQARVRRHNKRHHVAEAIEAARRVGIGHVNFDLMAGLPGQTLASFEADLRFLLSCEPDSIHVNSYRPLPRVDLARRGIAGPEDADVALRSAMQARADALLEEAGHTSDLGQVRRRTRNAANIQEYDLRRQNSSLLGLGVPSRAHAFGGAFYLPAFSPDLSDVRGDAMVPIAERTWQAVRADDVEEQHKYLFSNMHTGFDRAEYRALFGHDVLERHADALQRLVDLGAASIHDDRIDSHVQGTDALALRALLMSPALDHRAREVWGGEYDPGRDYRAMLDALVRT